MQKIMISKKEYAELINAKLRYDYLREVVEGDIFSPPPVRNTSQIVKAFKDTKKYNPQFLKSLEKGLKRSSFFK